MAPRAPAYPHLTFDLLVQYGAYPTSPIGILARSRNDKPPHSDLTSPICRPKRTRHWALRAVPTGPSGRGPPSRRVFASPPARPRRGATRERRPGSPRCEPWAQSALTQNRRDRRMPRRACRHRPYELVPRPLRSKAACPAVASGEGGCWTCARHAPPAAYPPAGPSGLVSGRASIPRPSSPSACRPPRPRPGLYSHRPFRPRARRGLRRPRLSWVDADCTPGCRRGLFGRARGWGRTRFESAQNPYRTHIGHPPSPEATAGQAALLRKDRGTPSAASPPLCLS